MEGGVKGLLSKMELFSRITVNPIVNFPKYLKWANEVVGVIDGSFSVRFLDANENIPLMLITNGKKEWSYGEFKEFLSERVPSRTRRDIENILHLAGLSTYNVFRLAQKTRAVSPRDALWLAMQEDEVYEDIIPEVFKTIYRPGINFFDDRDLIYSPEGENVKYYSQNQGALGIVKERLNSFSTDVESELAVYRLGSLMGVRCCEVRLVNGKKGVACFSKFEYNFLSEYIIHVRRLFADNERTDNLYQDLCNKLPEFKDDIRRMILLDFVTRQDDRHLSNVAVKVSDDEVSFYPLYDNGRSLFFEDDETLVAASLENIEMYSTNFGQAGTYYDYAKQICREVDVSSLVDLEIEVETINAVYQAVGLKTYRLVGATLWTYQCLQLLKGWNEEYVNSKNI